MFKLEPNPTFWASVKITVPGEPLPAEIEVEFRHQPREAIKAWIEASRERDDHDTLAQIVAGWRNIDPDFSPAALRVLVSNYPASANELFTAYLTAMTESRAKN